MQEKQDYLEVMAPGANIAGDAFALEIDTEAFSADIPRAAIIVINPSTHWITGKIALIENQNSHVLRRLVKDGDRCMLQGHDQAPWQAVPFDPLQHVIVGHVACAYKQL